MVVEVVPLRSVFATDIDDGDARISEVELSGFTAHDGHTMNGSEQAAGEQFVLMRAAWMSENE
jgi:hypothetical protein